MTTRYDDLLNLAAACDAAGQQLRERARLGTAILTDPAVTETAELSPRSYAVAEEEIRAATSGKRGLLNRSIELDADALVVRATVLTYRWIDELQQAAYHTLGRIAGRAIGYLAPEVELGGAIVSAGLIETDALDRDGVAAYLSELAEHNPDLFDHVNSGGGGLLDALQMRSLLTSGVLSGESGPAAARGGLRATGAAPFLGTAHAALRDAAGGLVESDPESTAAPVLHRTAPGGLEELVQILTETTTPVAVDQIGADQYIAYLPGWQPGPGRLRLVGGDHGAYQREVTAALERAVSPSARLLLVGSGRGGVAAAALAASGSPAFTIDYVVTAGAPAAQVPWIPQTTRVLSLEDRSDPVALLGSLINAEVGNRLAVVFDGGDDHGRASYLAGARAADRSEAPDLVAELDLLRRLGYLA